MALDACAVRLVRGVKSSTRSRLHSSAVLSSRSPASAALRRRIGARGEEGAVRGAGCG